MSSDSSTPEMSAATKDVLSRVQRMIPPMLEKFHKGQLGRVAVLGGSVDYTGAPYFSAMASARLGCDMSHVICTPGAASVIKTYSPNLMVHPLMRQTPSDAAEAAATHSEKISGPIIDMLARLHVLVIGPGLGRDPLMQETVARVIRAARERSIPLVLDADALLVVQKDPGLVKGYELAVLTPNVVEFSRLCKALEVDEGRVKEQAGGGGEEKETAKVEALARALEGVTIVQKGAKDFISNGRDTLVVDLQGGLKRSGGQGDTLTGSIATFLGWRHAYLEGLWDRGGDAIKEDELVRLAAFGGSAITRECSRRAFLKKGRSLQASDLTDEVHGAFMTLFGEVDGNAGATKL
ncbi:carbohydrate kinase [Colletotrichum abscissum]|uniref:ATP-dependent (S)-NAD(P)H-hydrate dehydratase n=1 Tax=Colletotrichum abscissum TaxID=1671311 RepID=A0A9P9XIM6_9PEZI|nr:carbohydrate kinase [Colletotrichum abscissum]KAI3554416.1 carbohydrate kinase [Colletotrichum abscissum]KAK1488607.1 carbohydrate kinase [Colletotrichum abscissum]